MMLEILYISNKMRDVKKIYKYENSLIYTSHEKTNFYKEILINSVIRKSEVYFYSSHFSYL